MKQALVTGAAGFIGFHLVRALLRAGYAVVGIDNLNSYYSPALKLARLAESGIDADTLEKEGKETPKPTSLSFFVVSTTQVTRFRSARRIYSLTSLSIWSVDSWE